MDILAYIVKANIAIVLFYGLYRLFFGKDTFFRFKRIVFLSIFSFSLAYPFIDIAFLWKDNPVWTESIPTLFLNEVIVTAEGTTPVGTTLTTSWLDVLSILYLIGVSVLTIRLFVELFSTFRKIKQSSKQEISGRKVYINKGVDSPFSFFRYIVINPDKHTEHELKEILSHEETHVRQWHSLDTLFCELICVSNWFNPFVWLMRNEIRMNLEYLADRAVVNSGCDAEHYQFHLLRLTHPMAAAKLINNFNFSPLKQRILMMNKKKTHQWAIGKYMLFVFIAAGLLFANCTKANSSQTEKLETDTFEVKTEAVEAIDKTESAPQETKIREDIKDTIPPPPIKKEEKKATVQFVPPVIKEDKAEKPADDNKETDEVKVSTETIYNVVELTPQFPGGEQALYKFLADNLVYPEEAIKNGEQGTVLCKFIVRADGSVDPNVLIFRGVTYALDREAVRVVKLFPNFTPGYHEGEPVSVYYLLPIKFSLPSASE